MSGFALSDLQQVIFTKLSSDSGLASLGVTVGDWITEQTQFPYISIGDDTGKEYGSLTSDGMDVTITIHSWSRQQGRKEIKTIMQNIYRVLHKSDLSNANQAVKVVTCEFSQSVLDPDGVTYHGIQRFRALTQGV